MATIRRLDPSLTSQDTSDFTYALLHHAGFLPDVYNDLPRLIEKYRAVMAECCQPWAVMNHKGKLSGVFFVSDVIPEHEGTLYFWLWEKSCYTHSIHRFILEYLEASMTENGLIRLVCRTPDEKGLGRLLERLGFCMEGRFSRAWKSGGKASVLFQFRKF